MSEFFESTGVRRMQAGKKQTIEILITGEMSLKQNFFASLLDSYSREVVCYVT